MRTLAAIDKDLEDRRHELINAEDCPAHRTVPEIRDEITALRHERERVIPKPREP